MTLGWPRHISPFTRERLERSFVVPQKILLHSCDYVARVAQISIVSAREAQIALAEETSLLRTLPASPEARRVSSGILLLDDILDGGFKKSWIVELVGESGSGKTQWSLTIAARALEARSDVFWIDTENTFRPSRIIEILGDRPSLLEQLHYKSCSTLSALLEDLSFISHMLENGEQGNDIPLPVVIIDSIAAAAIAENVRLRERNELLYRFANLTKSLNAVTFVTNQVRANVRHSLPVSVPALGNSWGHDVNCRLLLKATESGKKRRCIEVLKAPGVYTENPTEVGFCISHSGILGFHE
jgi:RecA/RadA recombinase